MSDRGTWWRRRGLRTRLVLSSAVPLAVTLVLGTVAVGVSFAHGRVADVDAQTQVESDALTTLLGSGQLPGTLPVPPGSALLAQVVDAEGSVLASSPSASRVVPLLGTPPGRGPRVRTEDGADTGEPIRVRVAPVLVGGRPGFVVVAAPFLGVRRTLHTLFLLLLLVVPGLIGVATVFIWRVAGLALRPVERLRAAAAALASSPELLPGRRGGESGSRDGPAEALPVLPGDDELARLSRTLNGLLASLASVLAQQQVFLADAAHELRSPLTSMRVQLDVAAAHPETVDVAGLAADLGAEVERLGRLTDDLLLLARFESGRPRALRRVDLRALAGCPGEPVPVLGDEDALRRLLDNLLTNAGRYADRVVTTVAHEGGWVVLDVDDDGPGIGEADRERVFDRWVRLDQARARGSGGSGLGLSLVREIARAHGGEATILRSPLGGTRVRVRLPECPP